MSARGLAVPAKYPYVKRFVGRPRACRNVNMNSAGFLLFYFVVFPDGETTLPLNFVCYNDKH